MRKIRAPSEKHMSEQVQQHACQRILCSSASREKETSPGYRIEMFNRGVGISSQGPSHLADAWGSGGLDFGLIAGQPRCQCEETVELDGPIGVQLRQSAPVYCFTALMRSRGSHTTDQILWLHHLEC